MKKISVVTGTRAEYGLLRPLLNTFNESPKFKLDLIVTGMHLSETFGYTITEIIQDGFEVNAKIPCEFEEEQPNSMAKSIGKIIIGVSEYLIKSKPDVLVVLGDRTEALGATIAAAYLNIPVAHLSGGDTSWGGLDESARHAITKLSHIHFPSTKTSAERIQKLGEDDWRIFPVGLTGVDEIMNTKFLSKKENYKKFNIEIDKPYVVLVQHPVSTEPDRAIHQITETLEAIKEIEIQTVVIYPNSDSGGRTMITRIKKYENLPFIKSYTSLSRTDYLNLLKYASALVGNSSSGMTESASFHLPVVNIGIRQMGRERGNNVIDVDHDKQQIIEAINKSLHDDQFKRQVKNAKNPYGDGNSAAKITEILDEINFNEKWIKKKITY